MFNKLRFYLQIDITVFQKVVPNILNKTTI